MYICKYSFFLFLFVQRHWKRLLKKNRRLIKQISISLFLVKATLYFSHSTIYKKNVNVWLILIEFNKQRHFWRYTLSVTVNKSNGLVKTYILSTILKNNTITILYLKHFANFGGQIRLIHHSFNKKNDLKFFNCSFIYPLNSVGKPAFFFRRFYTTFRNKLKCYFVVKQSRFNINKIIKMDNKWTLWSSNTFAKPLQNR